MMRSDKLLQSISVLGSQSEGCSKCIRVKSIFSCAFFEYVCIQKLSLPFHFILCALNYAQNSFLNIVFMSPLHLGFFTQEANLMSSISLIAN